MRKLYWNDRSDESQVDCSSKSIFYDPNCVLSPLMAAEEGKFILLSNPSSCKVSYKKYVFIIKMCTFIIRCHNGNKCSAYFCEKKKGDQKKCSNISMKDEWEAQKRWSIDWILNNANIKKVRWNFDTISSLTFYQRLTWQCSGKK